MRVLVENPDVNEEIEIGNSTGVTIIHGVNSVHIRPNLGGTLQIRQNTEEVGAMTKAPEFKTWAAQKYTYVGEDNGFPGNRLYSKRVAGGRTVVYREGELRKEWEKEFKIS